MFVVFFLLIGLALGQENGNHGPIQTAESPETPAKHSPGFLQLDKSNATTLTIKVLFDYNRDIKWFNVAFWPLFNSTSKCNESSTYKDLDSDLRNGSKLVQVNVSENAIKDFEYSKVWGVVRIQEQFRLFDLNPNQSYGLCLESNQLNDGNSLAWCNCTGDFQTTLEIGKVQHLYFTQEKENYIIVEWEAPPGFENYRESIHYNVCLGYLKCESTIGRSMNYSFKHEQIATNLSVCVTVLQLGEIILDDPESKCTQSSGSGCAKQLNINVTKNEIDNSQVNIQIKHTDCSNYTVSIICYKAPTCKSISECDTINLRYDDILGGVKFAARSMATYKILIFYEDEGTQFLVATKEYFHDSDYSDEAVTNNKKNTSISITWIRPWYITEPVTISSRIIGLGFPEHNFVNVVGCSFTVIENDLEPYKNYNASFSVSGSNTGPNPSGNEGFINSRNSNALLDFNFATEPGVCNKVTLLGIEKIKFDTLKQASPTVLFRLPLNMTGVIEKVHLSIRRPYGNEYSEDFYLTDCLPSKNCSIKLEKTSVQPGFNYTIEMYCKNANTTLIGISSSIVCKTEPSIPELGKDVLIISKQKWARSRNSSTVEVMISTERLDKKAGTIRYAVICYDKRERLPRMAQGYLNASVDFPICTKNVTFEPNDPHDLHPKTKLTNLNFNEDYAAVVYYKNDVAFTFSNFLYFKTRENPTPSIVAVSLIILIFIILFILSMYFSRLEKNVTSALNLPDLEFYPSSLEGGEFHHPISKVSWKEELQELLREPKIAIKKEFFSLSQKNIHGCHPPSTCIAEHQSNISKNRYFDIVPYDFSRVVLQGLPGKDSENYINATYIHGYNVNCGFIACQGPKDSTVHDFWRMVVEKNVRVIVMLTRCVEGREKCYKYWPSMTPLRTPSNTSIQPLQETADPSGDYTIRKFLVSQGWETQEVVQFHFTAWPDKKCPRTANFYSFISEVKSYGISESSPVVVHCSAGVGRTGTFIALYNLLDEMHDDKKDFIDIYYQVLKMRCLRNYMVQTQSQYIFLYESIFQLFQDNSGELPRNESADRMSNVSYEELSEDEDEIA